MAAKREQILVGGFVAVAVGILLFTMLYIDGVFRGNGNLYRAHFKNAGGLRARRKGELGLGCLRPHRKSEHVEASGLARLFGQIARHDAVQ